MLKESLLSPENKSEEEQNWLSIKDSLRSEYGVGVFNSWIKHLEVIKIAGGEVTLSAPTRFIREWNRTNYSSVILCHWQKFDKSIKCLDIVIANNPISSNAVRMPNPNIDNDNQTTISGTDVSGQNINVLPETIHQEELGSPLDRRFTFDNFVTGSSNDLAHRAAKTVASSKNPIAGASPLYIYGGVGLGKTHLMHAIAWHMRKTQPEKRVVYLSAEKFMFEFIRSLRNKDVMLFKENFRSADVLLIDDIQFIAGKESTQEEFYHTLNSIIADNKQLIIAGDRSPSDLEGFSDRVRSRLGGGLVVDVQAADYELRLKILKSKMKQTNGADISDTVLEFLAFNVTSSLRELEGALNKIIAHTSLFGKEVSVENARTILSDLLRANERVLTISEIQRKVASYYNIKIADMSSSRRMRSIARPRQVAMYLAKQITTRSLSEIGRKFGGKDHTTVMHAVKRIESLLKDDIEIKEDIRKITQALK